MEEVGRYRKCILHSKGEGGRTDPKSHFVFLQGIQNEAIGCGTPKFFLSHAPPPYPPPQERKPSPVEP